MKLTGFILEHHSDIGTPLKEYTDNSANYLPDREKVIKYLKSGVVIFSWMGYVNDIDTGEPLVPDSYMTDGFYVWPNYLIHYYEKYPRFLLDTEFTDSMIKGKFKIRPSKIDIDSYCNSFLELTGWS